MARIFTEQEVQAFIQAEAELRASGLHVDQNEQGQKNAMLLAGYFSQNPTILATVESIKHAAVVLKERLLSKTAVEIEADKIAARMNDSQVNLVVDWIKSRGLLQSDGEALLTNFNIISNWILSNRHPFAVTALDKALNSVMNEQEGYRLVWIKRLQDSEKEVQRQHAERNSAPPRQERAEAITEYPLAPHLCAHREMLRRPVEGQEPSKPATSEWRGKAESVLQNTNSHVIRAEAARILAANNGVVDWEATYRMRERHIAQRNQQRQNAR